ncbi:MAG: hypothetical protein HFH15_09485 [Ruminococcus sp.]|jgi:hypothetical protein|nr:hypothetical protein [Ruminococcus sp.]
MHNKKHPAGCPLAYISLVHLQNSALDISILTGSYVYVLKTGNASFSALIDGTSLSTKTGTTLDGIHNNIAKYNTGIQIPENVYHMFLSKANDKGFCGILMTHYMNDINSFGLPVYFSYYNVGAGDRYCIFAPKSCT